jgi:lipid-binding SYLF domain-containing protein
LRIVKIVCTCLALSLGLSLGPAAHAADKYQETIANFKKAETAKPYFSKAYGYAVFPTIGKGGIGIGGAGGKGHVYQQGKVVGESTMVQLSVGFQLGGQAFSQIVFFEDKRAFDEFTSTGFEFGADASAVAITAGANATAGTSGASASASTTVDSGTARAHYYKGMAVLTLTKGGLMYQAALAGQKYTFKRT